MENKRNVLHYAAREDAVEAAEVLVNFGIGVNSRDGTSLGSTPLHYASEYGSVNVAKLLVQNEFTDLLAKRKSATCETDRAQPIHLAAK